MTYKALLTAVVTGMLVAACDSGGGYSAPDQPPSAPPPPSPSSYSSNFGAGFEDAFQQAKFDEPLTLDDLDIIAVDITADPLDVPESPD